MKNKAKSNRTKTVIATGILTLSVLLMFTFATALTYDVMTTRKAQNFYENVAANITVHAMTQVAHMRTAESTALTESATKPFIDFDVMREEFPDIIGWIKSEGTPINYPIVQGTDNEFYLNHLPNRTQNRLGSIYMDYRHPADFSGRSTFIYGHNTPSGKMFGTLSYYKCQEFFEKHSSMLIFTETQIYELVLFVGYIIDSNQELPPTQFSSQGEFDKIINDIRHRSIFESDVEVTYYDRLVFLCTCTTSGPRSERLIIGGILVEL